MDSFLKQCLDEPAWTSFMTIDDGGGIHDVIHSLVISLHDHFAFYRHSVYIDFEIPQTAMNTIIFMSNASSLEDSFYVMEPCDRGCPFILILTTAFQDEQQFLEEAGILTESMWNRRLSTVIVLAGVRDSVLAAGSVTFQPGKLCTPSSPVILGRCEESFWDKLEKIREPERNDCILKIGYFEESPYVITTNDTERLMGFEGNLIEEMMKNEQIERESLAWTDNASYADQMQMYLYNDIMADLIIGRVLQQSHEDVDYSTSYDMLKVVWLVPKVPNVSLKGLIQPFHPYVWAAVGGALVLGSLIKIFLIHDLSYLDIFALIIGVSTARQPTRLSTKIQYISWSIFGLFLTQLYIDALADQLINLSDLRIDTTKQLMASFEIGGSAAFASLFDGFEETDEMVANVRNRFVVFDHVDYLKQFRDLLEGKNSSFALVTVLNSSRSDTIETMHAYTMTTEEICSFPLAFATWNGFPFLRQIDTTIQDYIDRGILDFMIELAIGKDTRALMFQIAHDQEYMSELHLKQFVPAFLVIVIGFSGGFILFVLEVALYPKFLN
ncbi:hypothetical protein WN48_08415 [Eufriesea mexicana]|uniref:Ionotropic glutamate receptor C-terminal domain-containing protein n=1 Tax=Eufriesea mexicana TaxID=516756 RepID=A0A310SG53_9HYME|nr:hypothetical protein WN48_08415 [Eufriesea mexicana]